MKKEYPRPWTENDTLNLTVYLQNLGLNTTPEIVAQAVQIVAAKNRFHPVRDWLSELEWDGAPRLDTWLIDYAGAEDTPYTRAISARFLISAIARVFRPGCKVDCALILEGQQGIGKSSLLRILFDGDEHGWFTDEIADLGSKDSALQLRGVWCVELAELDAMNRADVARLKAFITRTNDRYRPPYGRTVVDVPRQCVFAGSVNDSGYLRDPTGGRRFWPVKCGDTIDFCGAYQAREQIWAEAMIRYNDGEKWHLHEADLIAAALDEQSDRMADDAWDGLIADYLNSRFPSNQWRTGPDHVRVGDILEHAIGIEKGRWGRSEQMRVSSYLKQNGWVRVRVYHKNARSEWMYRRVRHSE